MKTVLLYLTAAIALAGEIAKRGTVVEVTEGEARDLLHRGKARIATEAEVDAAGYDIPTSGGSESELHPDIAEHQADRAEQAAEAAAAAAAATVDAPNADAAAGGQGGKSGKRGK